MNGNIFLADLSHPGDPVRGVGEDEAHGFSRVTKEQTMPEYLISVIGSTDDAMPADKEIQALYASVDAFNKEVQAAGQWVFAGGLQPIDEATTVDGTGEDVVVTDGPFSESKEFIGGFWVVKAADFDAALDLAARGSKACQGRVEVRAFQSDPNDA